jgi:hypothetical protein
VTRQTVTETQAGFGGGLNLTADPAFLRPDQARMMVEFRLSIYGAAVKRLGTALTTVDAITLETPDHLGGIFWPLHSQAYIIAAGQDTSDLHLYTSAYVLPTVAGWSDLGPFPQWRPVIFTDGVTQEVLYAAGDATQLVYKYDGVTITSLPATTARVDGVCVYNDRLWGWHGNSLYYSDLSSTVGGVAGDSLGDVQAGGGQIIVRTFGASDIVRCAPVNGSLLIFHKRGISVLTGWGQDDIDVQPQALNATIGMGSAPYDAFCVANESSQGDTAYFATDIGIYATNGATVKPLGSPDKPDPVAWLLSQHGIVLGEVVLTFNHQGNEVWAATVGDGVYVFNVILGSWSGPFQSTYLSGSQAGFAQTFFEVTNRTGQTVLWRAVHNSSFLTGTYVMECDRPGVYTDNLVPGDALGLTVTGNLQLHRFFAGDRSYSKSWRWLNITATIADNLGLAVPPLISTTTLLGGVHAQSLPQPPAGVETICYVSPGGMGPWIDVLITDSGVIGPNSYATVIVQGNLLGQR